MGDEITAKTKALLYVLRMFLSMGIHHLSLKVEGDCANVIGWLKEGNKGP